MNATQRHALASWRTRRRRVRRALSGVVAASALALGGCLSVLPMLAPEAKDVEPNLGTAFPFDSRYVDVLGSRMHYVETGTGDPILLVHGNPTSSYLWRNVIPLLEPHGRVIAVDLIGMGQSDKPDIEYRFDEHAAHLSGFVEALGLERLTLVLHDWGGALGLDHAARHPDAVEGIVFMEALMRPMSWETANAAERYLFGRFRDPEDGHRIIAEDNWFVESMLPMATGRELSDEEMAAYRAPYPTVESRRPVARWPIEIPIEGVPERNARRLAANWAWLRDSDVPVLLLYAEPGMIVKAGFRATLVEELPRMTQRSVGSGIHYLQETQPTRIGTAIADWLEAGS